MRGCDGAIQCPPSSPCPHTLQTAPGGRPPAGSALQSPNLSAHGGLNLCATSRRDNGAMEGNNENYTALQELPGKPPLWVRAVYWPGLLLFFLIFLSGAEVWSDKLFELLAGWGITVGSRGLGGIVLYPVLIGVFMAVVDARSYRSTARPVAEGVLWGVALFLTAPAILVLLHLAAPDFAATESAAWASTGVLLLLLAVWVYVGYRRNKRELEQFMSELARKAHNRNAQGPGNDGEADP